MKGWGAHGLLVSGGFTDFVEAVVAMVGFDNMAANRLGVEEQHLTGEVEGEIVDALEKARQLVAARMRLGIDPARVLAVGDGANDMMMIEAAIEGGGLGAAYHAKPALAEKANFSIQHNDLTALLYVQGISRERWAAN
jgi:phosphoserine phosphatase